MIIVMLDVSKVEQSLLSYCMSCSTSTHYADLYLLLLLLHNPAKCVINPDALQMCNTSVHWHRQCSS
jgi:hypothetical protein